MYVCVSLPPGGDHSLALFTLCSLSLDVCMYFGFSLTSLFGILSLMRFPLSSHHKHETLGKIPHDPSIHLFLLICILWKETSCVSVSSVVLSSHTDVCFLSFSWFFAKRKRTGCREGKCEDVWFSSVRASLFLGQEEYLYSRDFSSH